MLMFVLHFVESFVITVSIYKNGKTSHVEQTVSVVIADSQW